MQTSQTHTIRTATSQKSFSSPICSKSTPIKQFGAMKTPMDTIPIQNFFHHNLKFEHQADVYYLQDKDFLKNAPKIEMPYQLKMD